MSTTQLIPVLVYADIQRAHDLRAAGATIESAPTDQDYGQREYGVSDLEGHRWWFASPLGSTT